MKIGLLGYYGANAYCDDYLESAIRKVFDDISKDSTIEWVKFRGDINTDINGRKVDSLDAVILGGGSILGVEYGIDKLKDDIPFYIYGSGFREIETNGVDRLERILDRATYISLRGNTCINRLKILGISNIDRRVEMIGDPIFLYGNGNNSNGNNSNGNNSNGNNSNGNNSNGNNRQNVDKMKNVGCVGCVGGVFRPYITDDLKIKQIYEYLQNVRKEKVRLFSFAEAQGDVLGARKIGFETVDSLDARETYNEMIKSSFWFGNRLHPFCISLIHGIPTIGLDIEFNKVESVCSSINYPYWIKNDELSLDTFIGMYNELMSSDNHDENRKINEVVQNNIGDIRNNLKKFAKKIYIDIV